MICMSSAYYTTLEYSRGDEISTMLTKISIRPNTEPCGTLEEILIIKKN